jgi:hypothetical protein
MNDTKNKTFNDLDFHAHRTTDNAIQARLDLGDGFEISVVSHKDTQPQFGGLYGDASNGTYEVAMFHNDKMLPLAKFDDVLGWQDEMQITRLMLEAQRNGVAWVDLLHEIRNDFTQWLLSDSPHSN